MDREELRRQAASRRSGAELPAQREKWLCSFCNREFTFERAFMNHRCKGKIKLDELRSPTGQAAYAHYCTWMRLKRHTVQSIEKFGDSAHYSPFIKFAQWAERTRLPTPEGFIKLMVETNVQPALWARDNTYAMYLRTYDAVVSPEKQFLDGLTELKLLAEELRVSLPNVFARLTIEELCSLIQKRKLTHWVLLASPAFKANVMSRPAEERELIGAVMQLGAALERMKQEPQLVALFAQAAAEEGL